MMRLILSAITPLLFTGWSATAQADALLDQVVAGIKADQAVAWRVDRINTDFTNTGAAKSTTVAKYDGAAPRGTRWMLSAVDGKSPSKKASSDFADSFNKTGYTPTYAQLADLLSAGATKISEAPGVAHYRVACLPAKSVMAAGYDLSKGLQADVSIDTSGAAPFVNMVRITAPKPFKPASIGRVDKLDRSMTFARGPNGLPVLTQSEVNAQFKVLMKNITMRTHTAFQNQQPVVQTAQLGHAAGAR